MPTKTHVVTTKGILFGYEADLKMNRYAVTAGTKKELLDGSYSLLTSDRDAAIKEAQEHAAELRLQRGKCRSLPVRVFAIQQKETGMREITDAELIVVCEKYKDS